jgi:hypothetical protein
MTKRQQHWYPLGGGETMPPAASLSKAAMLDAALDALPEWCDRDSTRKSMTHCARKNHPGTRKPLDRPS